MPLREIWGAKVVGEDGALQDGGPVYYYQPFTNSDIQNWKHHTPAYSEKPQAMVDLEMIFQTQKPTCVDCKQLLFTFFNTEERMRVVSEAWKWLQTQAPAGILDTDRWAREAFPDEESNWNPNSEDGRTGLERYRLAFLQGVRARANKPTNMAKISEVFQKPDESPAAFYERLCEAYRIYTPFRPEAPENQTMVNAFFVGQAQPDIRRNLQKLEGFAGNNATELLEIANKVFINQDSAARKEEEKRIQRRANIIVAAFRGSGSQTDQQGYRPGGKGRASLRRDQCAYCKETGHWKNECPKRQSKKIGPPFPPSGYQPEPPEADLIGLAMADSD
ncbi:hypothetical protein QTO34_000501 [Cnephaeus nilssonii]|uniref:CCHC-type domain-containing protein n=1 Tax=Cnephaeus nilssonii TaxID=3371016 RepID=A0AA40ICE5_CNENI|nr:hypothetical protein QTO34_000501 [Eptesicus nilssonii]